MPEAIDSLKEQLSVIHGLHHAAHLMEWDQETYMPDAGMMSRAHALGVVARIAHEMSTSPEFGRLLEAAEAEAEVEQYPPDSDEARLLWWTRRDFERSGRIPSSFVTQLNEATAAATQVWRAARGANDWDAFAPHLRVLVELQRQLADFLGYQEHPYEALLDYYEPEIRMADVRAVFEALREGIVPLAHGITSRPQPPDDRCLHGFFAAEKQWALAREAMELAGYDFAAGRMDQSAHPFCTTMGAGDVRVTLRLDETFFNPLFFAALHEGGHAIYCQGLPDHLARTPLHQGASAALHESQARLWENVVGRGRDFWQYFYPRVQETFPEQFGRTELDGFYRAINKVESSYCRVEADEVTYNLHVMLRFDIELALLEGALEAEQVPALWNEKMMEYVGVTPTTVAEGALQDAHWSIGLFGYFPTYTLGNVMSVQLYNAARNGVPELDTAIADGNLDPLRFWMRDYVHQHGRKFLPAELMLRATGAPLDPLPYVQYLRDKYNSLYFNE